MSGARSVLAAGWSAVADLLLPRVCAGCDLPGSVFCPSCAALLARPQLAQPRRPPPGFPPTVAAGGYAGPVRPAVVAFKEHGRTELARPLGYGLALAVGGAVSGVRDARSRAGPVVLVPVPSTAAALRHRGRDHVRELAARAAAELRSAGVPARVDHLVGRRGRSRDSAGLSAHERRANLAGAFELRPAARRLPVDALIVLVDDVVTSGASLAGCARVLTDCAGARGNAVVAAVVAATPRTPRRPAPPSGGLVITLRDDTAAGLSRHGQQG